MYNHVDTDPLVGTLFDGRYLINFLIDRGGMGNIYNANDVKRGNIVALKMLRPEFSDDPTIVRRFQRETEAVSCLKHKNICQLFDVGITRDGIHYFTMEFLEGRALDKILKQRHVLPPDLAIHYMVEVAAGLCDAHNHGIIHRDMKPANIFIVQTANTPEFIKILDFGVAKIDEDVEALHQKLTNAGSTLGTPYYMSPEQISGGEVDGRTDIYALGVILWECLFGAPPFEGSTLIDIFKATMQEKLPKLPPALRASKQWKRLYKILDKALQKDRDKRYHSMQAFLRDLSQLDTKSSSQNAQPILMETPPSLPVFHYLHAFTPARIAIAGAILCAVVALSVAIAVTLMPQTTTQEQSAFHTYKFFSDPPVNIILGEKDLGTTPLSVELDEKIPFSVVFREPSGSEYKILVTDSPKDVTGFAVNLHPEHTDRPMLRIETNPPDADITVDGAPYPLKTPCNIAASLLQMTVEIKLDGYRTETLQVITNGGEMKLHSNLFRP
ncbi:MAG: serine/threonine protein kinase [Proteobacteria bacterium]|nr:serine/threonine protein kinase [Pseudomonadota bacterium]